MTRPATTATVRIVTGTNQTTQQRPAFFYTRLRCTGIFEVKSAPKSAQTITSKSAQTITSKSAQTITSKNAAHIRHAF